MRPPFLRAVTVTSCTQGIAPFKVGAGLGMLAIFCWIASGRHTTVINAWRDAALTRIQLPSDRLGRAGFDHGGKKMLGFGGNKTTRANDNNEQATETPAMFETFEPRILMNGSFAGLLPEPEPSSNSNQVIVQNADRSHAEAGPSLRANLVSDSGSNDNDHGHLTNNPAIIGQVKDRDNDFVKLTGGFDQTSSKNFADLTSAVKSDGTLLLDQTLLQQLAGGALADGTHTLHLAAFDAEGLSSKVDVVFTLDTTAPTLSAKLAHDTGVSARNEGAWRSRADEAISVAEAEVS